MDNEHITLRVVSRYFYWFVTIFAKKYRYFSPKFGGEKKLSKSVSGYFKTKKTDCHYARGPGGGQDLNGTALFLRFPPVCLQKFDFLRISYSWPTCHKMNKRCPEYINSKLRLIWVIPGPGPIFFTNTQMHFCSIRFDCLQLPWAQPLIVEPCQGNHKLIIALQGRTIK